MSKSDPTFRVLPSGKAATGDYLATMSRSEAIKIGQEVQAMLAKRKAAQAAPAPIAPPRETAPGPASPPVAKVAPIEKQQEYARTKPLIPRKIREI